MENSALHKLSIFIIIIIITIIIIIIEDKNGSLLTENNAVLARWTDYCRRSYITSTSK